MSLFPTVLSKLIGSTGKTQNEICKELGVTKQKLSKWKTAYNEPSLDELAIIATYFQVTTDYLIGLENEDGSKSINISNSFNNNNGTINFKG